MFVNVFGSIQLSDGSLSSCTLQGRFFETGIAVLDPQEARNYMRQVTQKVWLARWPWLIFVPLTLLVGELIFMFIHPQSLWPWQLVVFVATALWAVSCLLRDSKWSWQELFKAQPLPTVKMPQPARDIRDCVWRKLPQETPRLLVCELRGTALLVAATPDMTGMVYLAAWGDNGIVYLPPATSLSSATT